MKTLRITKNQAATVLIVLTVAFYVSMVIGLILTY